ncbi:Microsomal glutathione S-transferase 3 [Blyttiomyces sp. JEL0837]|nr:Microsomal glutathione S-transferase 3 [Blyttiomyces sp. JEL0837]
MTITLTIPGEYGYVIATAAFSTLYVTYLGVNVGSYRRKAGINYPHMYASKEECEKDRNALLFNCAQRVHGNTLEWYPTFLTLLFTGGIQHPVVASIAGLAWIVGRHFYAKGYCTGDPKKRNGSGTGLGYLGIFTLLGLSVKAIDLCKNHWSSSFTSGGGNGSRLESAEMERRLKSGVLISLMGMPRKKLKPCRLNAEQLLRKAAEEKDELIKAIANMLLPYTAADPRSHLLQGAKVTTGPSVDVDMSASSPAFAKAVEQLKPILIEREVAFTPRHFRFLDNAVIESIRPSGAEGLSHCFGPTINLQPGHEIPSFEERTRKYREWIASKGLAGKSQGQAAQGQSHSPLKGSLPTPASPKYSSANIPSDSHSVSGVPSAIAVGGLAHSHHHVSGGSHHATSPLAGSPGVRPMPAGSGMGGSGSGVGGVKRPLSAGSSNPVGMAARPKPSPLGLPPKRPSLTSSTGIMPKGFQKTSRIKTIDMNELMNAEQEKTEAKKREEEEAAKEAEKKKKEAEEKRLAKHEQMEKEKEERRLKKEKLRLEKEQRDAEKKTQMEERKRKASESAEQSKAKRQAAERRRSSVSFPSKSEANEGSPPPSHGSSAGDLPAASPAEGSSSMATFTAMKPVRSPEPTNLQSDQYQQQQYPPQQQQQRQIHPQMQQQPYGGGMPPQPQHLQHHQQQQQYQPQHQQQQQMYQQHHQQQQQHQQQYQYQQQQQHSQYQPQQQPQQYYQQPQHSQPQAYSSVMSTASQFNHGMPSAAITMPFATTAGVTPVIITNPGAPPPLPIVDPQAQTSAPVDVDTVLGGDAPLLTAEQKVMIENFLNGRYERNPVKAEFKLSETTITDPATGGTFAQTLYIVLDYEACKWRKIKRKRKIA